MIKFLKKEKCSFCDGKLPKNPYKVYITQVETFPNDLEKDKINEVSYACDECAKILQLMVDKMEEALDDEYLPL